MIYKAPKSQKESGRIGTLNAVSRTRVFRYRRYGRPIAAGIFVLQDARYIYVRLQVQAYSIYIE